MKKAVILISLISAFLQADLIDPQLKADLQRFDNIFNEIGKKRVGIRESIIDEIKDPFVYKKEIKKIAKSAKGSGKSGKTTPKKKVLKLLAIFNDKVKINGKWYRLHQKIGEYRISKIAKGYVILRDRSEKIKLYLRKKDAKIKIIAH
ncbi:MAG: hypothetical protein GXO31_02335 [Epsilonproteobacteria bacterium]|nr:hypothetical protein [Campylobacterota bacterium]